MKKFILLFLISLVLSQIYDKDDKHKPGGPGQKVRCEGGKIVNGRCICPNGRPPMNGRCKEGQKIRCIGGYIKNGQCYCPRGTVLVNGRCEKRKNSN